MYVKCILSRECEWWSSLQQYPICACGCKPTSLVCRTLSRSALLGVCWLYHWQHARTGDEHRLRNKSSYLFQDNSTEFDLIYVRVCPVFAIACRFGSHSDVILSGLLVIAAISNAFKPYCSSLKVFAAFDVLQEMSWNVIGPGVYIFSWVFSCKPLRSGVTCTCITYCIIHECIRYTRIQYPYLLKRMGQHTPVKHR